MKPRRLFIGLPLPQDLVAAIVAWQRRVGLDLAGVKWERADRLHVTLVFLGATDPALVPAIPAALQGAVRRNRSGELSLGAAGAFPSLAEPRTIWLAVSAPNGWLDRLQSGIVTAMADFGVVPDDRPFQPHITGGRIRRGTPRPGRRAIGQAVRAARPPAPIIWPVSNVVLYESVAGPDGPTYLELDTAC